MTSIIFLDDAFMPFDEFPSSKNDRNLTNDLPPSDQIFGSSFSDDSDVPF